MIQKSMNVSLALVLVSLGFIGLYAIDYGVSMGNSVGLVPIDAFSKGVVMGIPSLVLPLIAHFIGKKSPSKTASRLVLINGGLVIVGGLVMAASTAGPSFDLVRSRVYAELALVFAIGALQMILSIKQGRIPQISKTN